MSAFQTLRDRLIQAGLETASRRRLVQTRGRLDVPGLQAPAQILRDRWGVPHIYAENEPDLVFAQGFVHAQDRLWQMEFYRRLTAGRLAEILGEEALAVDRWMRILGLRRVAEQEVLQMNDESRRLIEDYCAGVNACITQMAPPRGREHLPIEFSLLRIRPQPWTPADSLAWGKLMAWVLSGNWESELLRSQLVERLGAARAAELELLSGEVWPLILYPGQRAHRMPPVAEQARPFVGPGMSEGVGSNNWVVSAQRSASGAPLLANDMHLSLSLPAIFYENHLCGGDLHATGVSFPGVPLVVVGHNEHVAWGFTAAYPDVQDLYVEHLRRADDGTVEAEYEGEWVPAQVRREAIQVRGGETVTEEVVITRHGPVINSIVDDAPEDPLALRFVALDPDQVIPALYRMNRARDCYEFRRALRFWPSPNQNAVFADDQGNIAYQLIGKVPVRYRGDGWLPVPGWSGEYEWTGMVPFEDLPYLFNPPEGYIATANNRIVDDDFPYDLGRDYLFGDRAERIIEMLEASPQVDLAYIQDMQFDQLSPTARDLKRCMASLTIDDPELKVAQDLLRQWDGRMTPESPAAGLHEVLLRKVVAIVLGHKLEDLTERYLWSVHSIEWLRRVLTQPDSPWFDLGSGESCDEVLRLALRQAVDEIKDLMGPNPQDWAWGKLHTLTFGHIFGRRAPLDKFFNRGPYPVGGDATTVWALVSVERGLLKGSVVGPPFRFIADLSDLDHCQAHLAPGQSGQPTSAHFDDQIDDWFEKRYHPMLFRRPEVEAAVEATLDLVPGKKSEEE